MNFLSALRRPAQLAVTTLLLIQIGLFYAVPKQESIPLTAPLTSLPKDINGWRSVLETPMEADVANVLKADDTINRAYVSPDGMASANLFIAYFKSQRQGVSPHSPKVCLPSSGWEPVNSEIVQVKLPYFDSPQPINRYTVQRGSDKSVVMYWYMSHGRVVANEYYAKVFSMYDSVRYLRSDTSIVRIVTAAGDSEDRARTIASQFLQAIFPTVWNFLPGRELR